MRCRRPLKEVSPAELRERLERINAELRRRYIERLRRGLRIPSVKRAVATILNAGSRAGITNDEVIERETGRGRTSVEIREALERKGCRGKDADALIACAVGHGPRRSWDRVDWLALQEAISDELLPPQEVQEAISEISALEPVE